MIVVSDSGPLISLLKIDKLELLRDAYNQVFIPDSVFEELTSNLKFESEARQIEDCPFIIRKSASDLRSASMLRKAMGLDVGESDAIVLAEELSADLILMDELKGRSVARNIGLRVTGTIGLLATAFEEGLLTSDEIVACIEQFKASNRHVGADLYEWLMTLISAEDTSHSDR